MWWLQCRKPGFCQCTSDKTVNVYVQPHKWIVVPSTALHCGAHCLNLRNVTHNNLNARVSQCLQSWLGSWAPTRAWWLFVHPGMLWTWCSFGQKEMLLVVPSQCKPWKWGRTKGCCARTRSLFFFAKDAAFPAGCCGFAGVRWPEGCPGRISPCSLAEWECWCQTAPSGKVRVAGVKCSVCAEHGVKSTAEMAIDLPSFSYPLSPGH